jgi:hypothetical protein
LSSRIGEEGKGHPRSPLSQILLIRLSIEIAYFIAHSFFLGVRTVSSDPLRCFRRFL